MPELPEVQTTVNGLQENVIGLTIREVWTDYDSPYFYGSETIKDPKYFRKFKKAVLGKKIISVSRRAKNILIHLDDQSTILIHMKMTGHVLYGKYEFDKKTKKDPWVPVEPAGLRDPFNRHVHFVITFTNGRHLALSDTRKFAKVTLVSAENLQTTDHLSSAGPEPLDESFNFAIFNSQLDRKPNGRIKQVLMDQSIIAGIGNIYADESLWLSGIHPAKVVNKIPAKDRLVLFKAIKKVLSESIGTGGASTSDYRNIHGEKGSSQESHRAYRQTDQKCTKHGCRGFIVRIVQGGRGTHFCSTHQK